MKDQILVFSDIDGTLSDFNTYSIEPALPALDALKKNDIPLIICSSKTRAEIEKFRLQIGNTRPFISENGGAVFIPLDYFSYEFPYSRKDFTYMIIEFGTPYHKIRTALQKIQDRFPDSVKGFGDLSAQEVANLCGLSPDEGFLAKEREYDEPFILEDKKLVDEIQEIASEDNLRLSRGADFSILWGGMTRGRPSRTSRIYRDERATVSQPSPLVTARSIYPCFKLWIILYWLKNRTGATILT
jgi:mannosyl-3-phosphoglycerate phosphatase